MSLEDLLDADRLEFPPGAAGEPDLAEAAFVTSDLRGVSWQEQESLAFGALDPPPAEAESFWGFGGPLKPPTRPDPPRSWSFGGPSLESLAGAAGALSRRF